MRGESQQYDSPEAKYLAEKDEPTLRALLKGIRSESEARKWLAACNMRGVRDWRRELVVGWVEGNT